MLCGAIKARYVFLGGCSTYEVMCQGNISGEVNLVILTCFSISSHIGEGFFLSAATVMQVWRDHRDGRHGCKRRCSAGNLGLWLSLRWEQQKRAQKATGGKGRKHALIRKKNWIRVFQVHQHDEWTCKAASQIHVTGSGCTSNGTRAIFWKPLNCHPSWEYAYCASCNWRL